MAYLETLNQCEMSENIVIQQNILHFGIFFFSGTASAIVRLEIKFPGIKFENIKSNELYHILNLLYWDHNINR